jgi:drug/metabolite transporter (DMT)-like permease
VPATALVLALAAAVGHAVWNMLLARARDPEAATAVAMLVGVAVFAVPAAVNWDVDASVWPYVLGSALLELVYIALLASAYRHSDLSLIYPVDRGVAPVLLLVIGVAVLGVDTSAAEAAGVCLVTIGVFLLRGPRRDADPRGVAFGLAIAACIAGYTLIDNSGVERASALAYLELVIILPAFGYAAFVFAAHGTRAVRAELNPSSVVAGLLILSPFVLFLVALDLRAGGSGRSGPRDEHSRRHGAGSACPQGARQRGPLGRSRASSRRSCAREPLVC